MNYQVLRRSAASLMKQLDVDGKTVSEQLGHTLDVSQNVYTQAGIQLQTDGVNRLDDALQAIATPTNTLSPVGGNKLRAVS